MKKNPGSVGSRWLLGLLLCLPAWPTVAAEDAVMHSGAVSYLAGGVGDESRERLLARAGEFNLQLLFAARTGNYLADVAVTIRDGKGALVLETRADGPFLLVRLPPGPYEVMAAFDGTSVRQTTKIPASGRREMVFRWNVPVDGEGAAP